MFIGIDHGTTAIRFSSGEKEFKISRKAARDFTIRDLEELGPVGDIEGIALCYSMGDNFSEITPIGNLSNRGVVSREGAGEHIGGGRGSSMRSSRAASRPSPSRASTAAPRRTRGSRRTPTRRARRRSGSRTRSTSPSVMTSWYPMSPRIR